MGSRRGLGRNHTALHKVQHMVTNGTVTAVRTHTEEMLADVLASMKRDRHE